MPILKGWLTIEIDTSKDPSEIEIKGNWNQGKDSGVGGKSGFAASPTFDTAKPMVQAIALSMLHGMRGQVAHLESRGDMGKGSQSDGREHSDRGSGGGSRGGGLGA